MFQFNAENPELKIRLDSENSQLKISHRFYLT